MSLIQFLSQLDPAVRAAIVSSITTVVIGLFGLFGVFWQIGRQARNAIAQTRDAERQKLKLSIYRSVLNETGQTQEALASLQSYLIRCRAEAFAARTTWQKQHAYKPLTATLVDLILTKSKADVSVSRLNAMISQWIIIEPKLDLFKIAFEVAQHDAKWQFEKYKMLAEKTMPTGLEKSEVSGTKQLEPLSDEAFELLCQVSDAMSEALVTQMAYVQDFSVSMQSLLLSDLFERDVISRRPRSENAIVVTLDEYADLKKYFLTQTMWGKGQFVAKSEDSAK